MEAERNACGDPKPSLEDGPKPTRSMEPIEPSNAGEEAWILPVPTGKGISEGVVAASTEPAIIILQKFPTIVTGPLGLPPP